MNLDEIKAKVLQKLSIYKSQVLFDPNSDYMKELELILKLCAALELAIKQRDDVLWSRHKNDEKYSRLVFTNLDSEAMDKEIEELLK